MRIKKKNIIFCFNWCFALLAIAPLSHAQPNEQAPAAVIPKRTVRDDEFRKSKDPTEDNLKKEVLQYLLEDSDKNKKTLIWLRKIFHELWTAGSARELIRSVEKEIAEMEPLERRHVYRQQKALNLLAYVAVKHEGCEVGEAIVAEFDRIFRENTAAWSRARTGDEQNYGVAGLAADAIGRFGDISLLRDGFFEWWTETNGGDWTMEILLSEELIEKLKNFGESQKWKSEQHRNRFDYRVYKLRQLLREKEKERERKRRSTENSSLPTPPAAGQTPEQPPTKDNHRGSPGSTPDK